MAFKTPDPLIQRATNKGYDSLLEQLKALKPESFKKFQFDYHNNILADEGDEYDETNFPYLSPEDYIESYDAQEGSAYEPESILSFLRNGKY